MKEIRRSIKEKPGRVVRIEVYKPEDMYYSSIEVYRIHPNNFAPKKEIKTETFLFSSPITFVKLLWSYETGLGLHNSLSLSKSIVAGSTNLCSWGWRCQVYIFQSDACACSVCTAIEVHCHCRLRCPIYLRVVHILYMNSNILILHTTTTFSER